MKKKETIRTLLKTATDRELSTGRFVPVSVAAAQMHVTSATILNRIKRGEYVARTFQGSIVLIDTASLTT